MNGRPRIIAWTPDEVPDRAGPDPHCERCGRIDRLITDDGPTTCRVCVMAWTAYAAVVATGAVTPEPGGAALAHLDHVVPRLGCASCHAALRARRPAPWPPLGRLPGP